MVKYSYSIEKVLVARLNEDGSFVTPADWTHTTKRGVTVSHKGGIVGGAGPFNLSSILDAHVADLTVRLGSKSDTVQVDFTAAVNESAVTVEEVVAAINGVAAWPNMGGITASKLTDGYLKVQADSVDAKWYQNLEITGELAVALGIDRVWVESDGPKSWKFDPQTETGESIKQTSGTGTKCTVEEPDKVTSIGITFSDAQDNPEMEEIIAGVQLDSTGTEQMAPELEAAPPKFCAKVFYKQFAEGVNSKTDQIGYKVVAYPNCEGIIGSGENTEGTFNSPAYSATGYANAVSSMTVFHRKSLSNVEYESI